MGPELYALLAALGLLIVLQILTLSRSGGGRAAADRLGEGLFRELQRLERTLGEALKSVREEHGSSSRQDREERSKSSRELRDELVNLVKSLNDSILKMISEMNSSQKAHSVDLLTQLTKLTESNQKGLEALRESVEGRLKSLQEDNAKQLDRMRETVDEKLQGTLEKRLGESFKQVSERLEQVYRGLGEMQLLANGVGDLKKVLTNVKTRGSWGEVQLGSLLEQLLTKDQFERNVKTKPDSDEIVEFAIRLPGRSGEAGEAVWLPVDSKFPMEDYERLVEAQQAGNQEAAEQAGRLLETQIKRCAKDIGTKYIAPPGTTDFAIMFVPTEGLYAEVMQRRGLVDYAQIECRVVIAGPATFAALLNALQMGFRTLAIEQRSSEVWSLLGAVKSEFGKFGAVLDSVKKKLDQASNTIDQAAVRSRAIEKKLRKVEELPESQANLLLGDAESMLADSEMDEE